MSPAKPYRRLTARTLPELRIVRSLVEKPRLTPEDERALRKAVESVHRAGLEQNVQGRRPLGTPYDSFEMLVQRFTRWRGHLPPVPPEQHGGSIRIRWNCVGDAFLLTTLLGKAVGSHRVGTILMPGHIVTTLQTRSGRTFVVDGSRVVELGHYTDELLHAAGRMSADLHYSGPHARQVRAMNLHQSDRPRNVLNAALIFAGTDGATAAAHYNFGKHYLASDIHLAEDHFHKALRLVPDFHMAWRELGSSVSQRGQRDRLAIKHAEQALRINRFDASAHALLAQIHWTRYATDGSRSHLRRARASALKALRLNSGHVAARGLLRSVAEALK